MPWKDIKIFLSETGFRIFQILLGNVRELINGVPCTRRKTKHRSIDYCLCFRSKDSIWSTSCVHSKDRKQALQPGNALIIYLFEKKHTYVIVILYPEDKHEAINWSLVTILTPLLVLSGHLIDDKKYIYIIEFHSNLSDYMHFYIYFWRFYWPTSYLVWTFFCYLRR